MLSMLALSLSGCGNPFHSSATSVDPSTNNRIVIDTRAILHLIHRDFFGINYTAFWEPAEGDVASARALAQTPIRTVRFPGGAPANFYDWQDPYFKGRSRTSPLQLWNWSRSFSATRVVFQTNFQGNMPHPPHRSYAVNSPRNAAAWVTYNRIHHISAMMEVGNEEDMHLLKRVDDPAYKTYIAGFHAQARAMHEADPSTYVLGPTGTNAWYWWKLDGLGMFLRAVKKAGTSGRADGVSLHYYDGHDWASASRVAQWWLSPSGPWAAVQKVMRTAGEGRLPVYITEWNLGNQDFHNKFNPTVGHALTVADMIGAFAQSGVRGEDYFTIHRSDGWGLLYGTHDARPVDTPMPTYYAMALWSHMGNRVVALKQTDDPASVMSSYATTDRHRGVQVLLINKQPRPRKTMIDVRGMRSRGDRLSIYSLRGASGGVSDLDAIYNGVSMPSPEQRLPGAAKTRIVRGNTLWYSVPGYSAVVLALTAGDENQR